jgi:hypothetical protein
MKIEQFKSYIRETLKSHKRIIKPWKVRGKITESGGATFTSDYDYARGWNECLKEIENNHKKFMKFYEENAEKYTNIISPSHD